MITKINAKAIFELCKEKNLIDDDITYKEFYYITRDFNKLISDKISEGYCFETIIGEFEVVKKDRNKRSQMINWGESNKKKQVIINSGEIPFNKETAPTGINWFIYFTSEVSYLWKWIRSLSVKKYYYFIPCWDNKRKLGKEVKRE